MSRIRYKENGIWKDIPSVGLSHSLLADRDVINQHPIEAIEGLEDALDGKQAALIGTQTEGQNIKTINNQSILGSGNLEIQGGGGSDIYEATITMSPGKLYFTDEAYAYIKANKPLVIKASDSGSIIYFNLCQSNSSGAIFIYEAKVDGIGALEVIIRGTDTASGGSDRIELLGIGLYSFSFSRQPEELLNDLKVCFLDLDSGGQFAYNVPVMYRNHIYFPYMGWERTGDNNNITKYYFGYTQNNVSYLITLTVTKNNDTYTLTKAYTETDSVGDLSNLATTAKSDLVLAINELESRISSLENGS